MTYYNIWAWKDAENPQRPDYHDNFKHRTDALIEGRRLSRTFHLVEVEQVEASYYDANDIRRTSLVRSWKNGIQQTK